MSGRTAWWWRPSSTGSRRRRRERLAKRRSGSFVQGGTAPSQGADHPYTYNGKVCRCSNLRHVAVTDDRIANVHRLDRLRQALRAIADGETVTPPPLTREDAHVLSNGLGAV